jgi:hypothetical protein
MITRSPMGRSLTGRYLGTLTLELERHLDLGDTPAGQRAFAVIAGGTFNGPELNATVLPGGSDALVRDADGAARPDVRLVLLSDDEATMPG